jgi:tetratricopeptide (TPR) repeat protein
MSLTAIKSQCVFSVLLLAFMLVCTPAAAALQRLQIGMEAPDFSVKGLNGEVKQFSALKGEKLTAVVFWSTWSTKSEPVLRRMQKLYDAYGSRGFSVIAVNVDEPHPTPEDVAAVKALAEKLKLTYPVLVDDGLVVFNDLGVIAVPTTVILDAGRTAKHELAGYPSEGAESMADFIAETIEGKKRPGAVVLKGHQPTKPAVRAFNMGNNCLKSRRLSDTAHVWFKKAIEADPQFVLPRIALGKFYFQRGEVGLAQSEFEQALAQEPNNIMALCQLGMVAVSKGKTNEAKLLIDKGMSTSDSYPECFTYAGLIYGKLGDVEKALSLFGEAAKLNPREFSIFSYQATMLEENKRPKDAVESYRKALEVILKLR